MPRRPDPFTLLLLLALLVATLLPARGTVAEVLRDVTQVGIGLMFFLYGARTSRRAAVEALTHWRLHLAIAGATYALFPLLGLAITLLPEALLPTDLALGVLFLTTLPSTVQSSIAFTSIARGNVPAAIAAASLSNLAGVLLTPLLVGLLMRGSGTAGVSFDAIESIALQLLLPFVAGQALQTWIGAWAARHKTALSWLDRGSILLIVYLAFSDAIVERLWETLSGGDLVALLLVASALLAAVLALTTWGARRLRLSREDEIALVFCGSKKSLATGIPMAKVLFAGSSLGALVLPLMLFHQLQLMACAALARRYARPLAPDDTPQA